MIACRRLAAAAILSLAALPALAQDFRYEARRGQSLLLYRYTSYDYQCVPVPGPDIHVWAQPSVGRVRIERSVKPAGSGPCVGKPSGITEVVFEAGPTAGRSEFTLLLANNANDSADLRPFTFLVTVK